MASYDPRTAAILVACDNPSDAAQVSNTLQDEFANVSISTNPGSAASDFERCRPAVMVLAFDSLEKSERYYLGLYRQCQALQQLPHRTVILCSKDDVNQVYELCKQNHFDDYVMYWPMTFDMKRLGMAVHHALRELATLDDSAPTKAEFVAQARRLGELEATLAQSLTAGGLHLALADQALAQAEQEIGVAFDGLSRCLTDGSLPEAVSDKNAHALHQEISRIKRDDVMQCFHAASKSTLPLKNWAEGVKLAGAPLAAATKALNALAEQVRSTVMVVDDDELQRKLVARLLCEANYQLLFAGDGLEALSQLRKTLPDLILMDVMMPGMDGVEVTRRLKASPRFASIPVVMITGQSDRAVVAQSLKAGACGFVVKPLVRESLLDKMAQALRGV